jgi:hypothetical protein
MKKKKQFSIMFITLFAIVLLAFAACDTGGGSPSTSAETPTA